MPSAAASPSSGYHPPLASPWQLHPLLLGDHCTVTASPAPTCVEGMNPLPIVDFNVSRCGGKGAVVTSSKLDKCDLQLCLPSRIPRPACAPCTHLLSAEAFQRSLVASGGMQLRKLMGRLHVGSTINMLAIGGSVAAGYTDRGYQVVHGGPSSERLWRWLESQYPRSNISYRRSARPGVTSAFCAMNVEACLGLSEHVAYPDLIVWDFSYNDYGTDTFILRATFESLVRSILSLPFGPALLVLVLPPLSTSRASFDAALALQERSYLPVASAYGLTVVSYMSAIWPAGGEPAARDPFWHGNHPDSSRHQLLADCLAYAWAAVEQQHDKGDDHASSKGGSTLGQPRFQTSSMSDFVTACEGGWKSVASMDESIATGVEALAGLPGWNLINGLPTTGLARVKAGWQFDAGAARTKDCDVHEPITFNMLIGPPQPRVLATYLRSYENFGRALVWASDPSVSDGEPEKREALRMLRAQKCYKKACEIFFAQVKPNESLWSSCNATELGWQRTHLKPNRLHMTKGCQAHLAGTLEDPHVLDGRWTQRHSLPDTRSLIQDYRLVPDPYVAGITYAVPSREERKGQNSSASKNIRNLTVHVGKLCDDEATRTRFKLISLHSC